MNLIATAYAAAKTSQTQSGGSMSTTIIMLVVFFAIFYFLLIRPQSKRTKQHRALLAGLGKADEVVTSAGVMGKITQIEDNIVSLEVAENVTIKLQKSAISSVLPKGTLEDKDNSKPPAQAK